MKVFYLQSQIPEDDIQLYLFYLYMFSGEAYHHPIFGGIDEET